jgi:arginine repressor
MAQAVAAGVDSLHEADILGCVAGDDCIIIVTRDAEAAVAISHRITKLINS